MVNKLFFSQSNWNLLYKHLMMFWVSTALYFLVLYGQLNLSVEDFKGPLSTCQTSLDYIISFTSFPARLFNIRNQLYTLHEISWRIYNHQNIFFHSNRLSMKNFDGMLVQKSILVLNLTLATKKYFIFFHLFFLFLFYSMSIMILLLDQYTYKLFGFFFIFHLTLSHFNICIKHI